MVIKNVHLWGKECMSTVTTCANKIHDPIKSITLYQDCQFYIQYLEFRSKCTLGG